jgi:hypothetical protein
MKGASVFPFFFYGNGSAGPSQPFFFCTGELHDRPSLPHTPSIPDDCLWKIKFPSQTRFPDEYYHIGS